MLCGESFNASEGLKKKAPIEFIMKKASKVVFIFMRFILFSLYFISFYVGFIVLF